MKFGRLYQEHLQTDGYPQHWVDTAISYRQLKKVIKRVEKELADIGLDIDTLKRLLQTHEKNTQANSDASIKYSLQHEPNADRNVSPTRQPFHPKLLIAVDDATDEPLDFGFAPDTLRHLHELAVSQKLSEVKITNDSEASSSDAVQSPSIYDRRTSQPHRMMEVALTSDSDFFNILQKELNGLEDLQTSQLHDFEEEVTDLGRAVAKVARPDRLMAKTDISRWRQIFQLYLESQIFFATHEQDHGAHDYEKASKNYQQFLTQVQTAGLISQFKKKESTIALHQFFKINSSILRALSFQELNHLAMTKILKKFDKRTAFATTTSFTRDPTALPLSKDISRAICAHLSTNLLSIIPQLDDYLCPICCDITWRPVRLSCQHVFCIRCLVVMQREKKAHCPLCREKVLLDANIDNIDPSLSNFLKQYFPAEVKAKQKSNEYLAGRDEYGDHFDEGCSIM